MGLFSEAVKNVLLTEDFEKNGFIVYHGTKATAVDGIADKGFERFFTSTNGGNMYGPGVYTTYKFSTKGQNARGAYGDVVYRAKVKSLKNFVIYDMDIASKVYGHNCTVDSQLKRILTPDQINRMKQNGSFSYDKLVNSRGDTDLTSRCALAMCEYFNYYDQEAGYQVNGYIFSGNHDGWVCFIKDFKNIIPFEMSFDCGKTWQPFKPTNNFSDFAEGDVDLKFQLGKYNFKLFKELKDIPNYFIGGFARVEDWNGKFNYLCRKWPLKNGVISPIWFDYAPKTFTNRGTANVMIENESYIIKLDSGQNVFRVFSSEGKYLCELGDFRTFIEMNNGLEDGLNTDDF